LFHAEKQDRFSKRLLVVFWHKMALPRVAKHLASAAAPR
jgi:hypothetical protein